MPVAVSIDEHFNATAIGNGLAKLWHVDSLSLRMENASDEDGMPATCPITMSPITRNAVLLQDGFVYQQGPIEDWLKIKSTSPLTNLTLGHRNSLRMKPLTAVLATFLEACQRRRDVMRGQQLSDYKNVLACSNSQETYDQHVNELSKLQAYIEEGRSEHSAWGTHLRELESIAAALGKSLQSRANEHKTSGVSLPRGSRDDLTWKARAAHLFESYVLRQPYETQRLAWEILGSIMLLNDIFVLPVILAFDTESMAWIARVFWTLLDCESVLLMSSYNVTATCFWDSFRLDFAVVIIDWLDAIIGVRANGFLKKWQLMRRFLRLRTAQKIGKVVSEYVQSEQASALLGTIQKSFIFNVPVVLGCIALDMVWYWIR